MLKTIWQYKGERLRLFHTHLLLNYGFVLFLPFLIVLSFYHYKVTFPIFRIQANLRVWQNYIQPIAVTLLLLFLGCLFSLYVIRRSEQKHGFFYTRKTKQIVTRHLMLQRFLTTKEKKTEKGIKKVEKLVKTYYKHEKEYDTITFDLVNEHFEKILELPKLLEQWLEADLVSSERNREFIFFRFLLDNVSKRMMFSEVKANEDEIVLMNGVKWVYRKIPHGLILAPTGAGKTFLQYAMISAFGKIGRVHLADPKRSDISQFKHFKAFKNLVVSNTEDIFMQYEEAVELMEKRYAYMIQHPNFTIGKDYSFYDMKPEFYILDEFAALVSELEGAKGRLPNGERRKDKYDFQNLLAPLILKARQCGIFFIFATQKATVDVIPSIVRDNVGLRVTLGTVTQDGYTAVFGDWKEKRFVNKGEKMGRGYFYNGTGVPLEFYSPLFEETFDPMTYWAEFPEMPYTDVSHISLDEETKKEVNEYLDSIETIEELEKKKFVREENNRLFEEKEKRIEQIVAGGQSFERK
ncbi:hypothetical protein SAMN02745116_01405 [Pilibacter termitis]|uniref:FtsK domain-containing protein n=1 Tax=Pilibacter termitis TaxID=263852 RepID=A0A1T4NFW8_9ENTE|nr:hypothetical protein [Pilibacter termitis]SJZ77678.1 hypothetical protein SAMN02745116_01405 [Pilibacter termitis]